MAVSRALLALLVLAGCGGSDGGDGGGGSAGAGAGAGAGPPIVALRLLGAAAIPTGTLFEGVEFGGISGLDRAADGSYWALSDERGGDGRAPRFYNLSIDYEASGNVSVQINRQTAMLREDGSAFPAATRTVDPEAIRVAAGGQLYWASEGNWDAVAARRFQPFVRQMTTQGAFVREFAIPAIYHYVDNRTQGARNNKVFESLAVAPDGTVYVANEDALIEDGPSASLQAGSVVRVTALDPGTGQARAQYAYELPKIPVDGKPDAAFGPDNGLSDMLAAGPRQFIAVERAFAFGVGNTIRLVWTEINDTTTDVSRIASLVEAKYTPMSRRLLLEMPLHYQGVKLDNIEAITWGKTLPNGNRTLVLASDNNFSATQTNQFIVLEVLAN
ncbi:esterase-like activity of phytase family protein [Verminephrobacter eiseniae]|uniref:esterase-like activity of phytase family protein n=1 Tax=Verminephrobacter eiseniae TaxID=364317 RepID=UPI0022378254|nr:esterase-like activity of phytase family protein [Verminephrobacter eiseniae]